MNDKTKYEQAIKKYIIYLEWDTMRQGRKLLFEVRTLMLGFLINEMEKKELEYLLKREMEELLHDLEDKRIDHLVKRAMKERYQIIFKLFKRVATEKECVRYIPQKNLPNSQKN